ncbi:MAG: hypothetical protein ACI9AV_002580 [Sediminicola sp.]|jgi:hypothetical protein
MQKPLFATDNNHKIGKTRTLILNITQYAPLC